MIFFKFKLLTAYFDCLSKLVVEDLIFTEEYTKWMRNHKIITEFAKHITESMNELIEAVKKFIQSFKQIYE